jgi:ABC-2 type transport system permease protein
MSAVRRIRAVATIELVRLLRSRMAFALLLIVPLAQVLLFGFAIRPDAATITIAIAAPSSASAKAVSDRLAKQPGFAIVAGNLGPGEAAAAVREGRALIGIEVPVTRSFANLRAPLVPLRVVVDASNAGLTATATARLETEYWHEIAARADAVDIGPRLVVERLYNPQSRPDWTFLPALIGVTVMIGMIMLGTLSLAREREGGTWEALLVLPIRPVEALAGKLLPHVVIGTLQGLTVLAIAAQGFDLPLRGSIAGLIVLLPLFAAAHLVLGFAMAARARTQLEALQGAIAFYLPAMLLSGFLYPFATLPHWAQRLGSIFPLTHFIRAAQGATIRGDDLLTVAGHAGPIALFLLAVLGVALLLQVRRLD